MKQTAINFNNRARCSFIILVLQAIQRCLDMKEWIPLILFCGIVLCTAGCMRQPMPLVKVSAPLFSIVLPLQTNARGIVLPVSFGAAKKIYLLNLDNHSPSWVNNTIINGNPAFVAAEGLVYKSHTAEGNTISGPVLMCDSVGIGSVCFSNTALYNISTPANPATADGVIGENIMRTGIWKLDFENKQVQFASSVAGITGWEDSRPLPAVFKADAIEVIIAMGNGKYIRPELDLGFNGAIILPTAIFEATLGGSTAVSKSNMRFTTPSGDAETTTTYSNQKICAGSACFVSLITTNDIVKEQLLGLSFLLQFRYVIIDFPGKKLYCGARTATDNNPPFNIANDGHFNTK